MGVGQDNRYDVSLVQCGRDWRPAAALAIFYITTEPVRRDSYAVSKPSAFWWFYARHTFCVACMPAIEYSGMHAKEAFRSNFPQNQAAPDL